MNDLVALVGRRRTLQTEIDGVLNTVAQDIRQLSTGSVMESMEGTDYGYWIRDYYHKRKEITQVLDPLYELCTKLNGMDQAILGHNLEDNYPDLKREIEEFKKTVVKAIADLENEVQMKYADFVRNNNLRG